MDDFEEILKAAIRHEEKLKEMYLAFSRHYPEDNEFWLKIAREEEAHARWIENIEKLYRSGEIRQVPTTLKIQAIRGAIDYVDGIIERCERKVLPRLQALSLALDVEKGMVENKIFKSFNFMSGKYKDTGTKLEKATVTHRDKILERLNEAKKGI